MVQYISHLKKLEILQKKIIRALSWSHYSSPTGPLFRRFNLLKLTHYNYLQNAVVMYQVVHKLNQTCDLIPIHLPLHTHNTRNKHLITGKKRKLKCTSFSVACRGPQIWNELDDTIKISSCISIFKEKLKKQLLSMYV